MYNEIHTILTIVHTLFITTHILMDQLALSDSTHIKISLIIKNQSGVATKLLSGLFGQNLIESRKQNGNKMPRKNFFENKFCHLRKIH